VPSLENNVEPPEANNNWLPEVTYCTDVSVCTRPTAEIEYTAENWVDVTPAPQAKVPPDTPQLP
jgi:hypothetical protein